MGKEHGFERCDVVSCNSGKAHGEASEAELLGPDWCLPFTSVHIVLPALNYNLRDPGLRGQVFSVFPHMPYVVQMKTRKI